ncbi:hypothetical protein ACLOJK_020054 [Asimina triloba]
MADSPDSTSASANGITRIVLQPPEPSIVDLTGQVHQLPCCIKHNGPCSVSDYFKPKNTGIVVDGLDVEEASFRGRKLQGTTLPIPRGYCGYVLERTKSVDESNKRKRGKCSGISEVDSSCWEARAKFQNITYWNHDSLPCKDDAFVRVFHWFAVANARIGSRPYLSELFQRIGSGPYLSELFQPLESDLRSHQCKKAVDRHSCIFLHAAILMQELHADQASRGDEGTASCACAYVSYSSHCLIPSPKEIPKSVVEIIP